MGNDFDKFNQGIVDKVEKFNQGIIGKMGNQPSNVNQTPDNQGTNITDQINKAREKYNVAIAKNPNMKHEEIMALAHEIADPQVVPKEEKEPIKNPYDLPDPNDTSDPNVVKYNKYLLDHPGLTDAQKFEAWSNILQKASHEYDLNAGDVLNAINKAIEDAKNAFKGVIPNPGKAIGDTFDQILTPKLFLLLGLGLVGLIVVFKILGKVTG